MRTNSENIAIYDFDGTLISFNSFKYWLLYSFILSLFFFRIDYNWLILKATVQRMFGKTDRIVFKEKIMNFHEQNKIFARYCNASFASLLKKKTKSNLLDKRKKMFLATGAPDCYVKYYVLKMKCFENYSASYIENGILKENIGEKKLQTVIQLIDNKIHDAILFTDSSEDIPLAQQVSQVFLICPANKTKKEYESAKISFLICSKTKIFY